MVIPFDHSKIVKKIVKKPCRDSIFSTELTGNSVDVPGQPRHENTSRLGAYDWETNQLFYMCRNFKLTNQTAVEAEE